jgi:hypothetical protein
MTEDRRWKWEGGREKDLEFRIEKAKRRFSILDKRIEI